MTGEQACIIGLFIYSSLMFIYINGKINHLGRMMVQFMTQQLNLTILTSKDPSVKTAFDKVLSEQPKHVQEAFNRMTQETKK